MRLYPDDNIHSLFYHNLLVLSGADFIKTSTGKEGVNAVLIVGLVMVRAIREYLHRTGIKVALSSKKSPQHQCKKRRQNQFKGLSAYIK